MVTSTKLNRSNTPRKPANISKKQVKPNASILSFFQKTQKQEESLFVGSASQTAAADDDIYSSQDLRFNESGSPVKKRRIFEKQSKASSTHDDVKEPIVEPATKTPPHDYKPRGRISLPFIVDSDSEDGDGTGAAPKEEDTLDAHYTSVAPAPPPANPLLEPDKAADNDELEADDELRLLKHQDSTRERFDKLDEFGDLDCIDAADFEGEEMRERKYMWEQARLEAEEEGSLLGDDFTDDPPDDNIVAESCPICNGTLAGVSADDASRHVNSCLDGHPIPLPAQDKGKDTAADTSEMDSADMSKRFARAAVPRPAQANPFERGDMVQESRSAFSKLMSNNAEDSAWTTAAAAEHASRGRRAYERTCPFYKIMPGFNICVDAFRYGAVQGCEAYFLSHFHSDHYIGLSGTWRHGPIYCSKVTGSLVKQQLRTASKWVVELEFDKSYDVPGTGATVTMIPANHCPGSSLFLFQKPLGAGPKSGTRRILHCGDFRACPEHVGHPLLKPEVVDSITGKVRQQTIHMCYLDTTYLNPRYSFPPQDEVIKACADLCASMSPDPDCRDDIWEHSAQASGTQTMSKYFHSSKADEGGKTSSNNKKLGQRLLVVCGTYSIGKERICIAIAQALNSKIFVSPGKMKICKQLRDPELSALLTSSPVEAQVHMQSLMEIRAETLKDYLASYKPHFSRIVGFRPSGWTFRPGNGKVMGANTPPSSVSTQQILHGKGWRTRFGYKDLAAQRGSSKEAMCFGVPYSEHSSFRELAMFVMSLRIEKVIPTVNVGSEQSRKRMKGWIDRWMAERKRGGLVRPLIEGVDGEDGKEVELWEGKAAQGGGAWW
ncbi:hypothetical protein G6O67_007064 [Ophiocordyceps sinensis]|uniref:DNA cross-link repair protein pso2/snm1 n=2 Tax=Ophiocordyceps sinensis TaxID=72228 RepID=A0A8H4LT48_9HYPO|nr:DNA repair metallo-beta-lactamase [Ophiocordyceps sinensis CO18]KAF4505080.1 hypothetical protein G6O67_007064 [Ophiocordyceps sinensis]